MDRPRSFKTRLARNVGRAPLSATFRIKDLLATLLGRMKPVGQSGPPTALLSGLYGTCGKDVLLNMPRESHILLHRTSRAGEDDLSMARVIFHAACVPVSSVERTRRAVKRGPKSLAWPVFVLFPHIWHHEILVLYIIRAVRIANASACRCRCRRGGWTPKQKDRIVPLLDPLESACQVGQVHRYYLYQQIYLNKGGDTPHIQVVAIEMEVGPPCLALHLHPRIVETSLTRANSWELKNLIYLVGDFLLAIGINGQGSDHSRVPRRMEEASCKVWFNCDAALPVRFLQRPSRSFIWCAATCGNPFAWCNFW